MSEGGGAVDEEVTGFSGGEDEATESGGEGFGTAELDTEDDDGEAVVESTTLSRAAMSPDLSTMKSNSSIKKHTAPVDTDDLAELEDLTDSILCECLDARYKANLIYVSVIRDRYRSFTTDCALCRHETKKNHSKKRF